MAALRALMERYYGANDEDTLLVGAEHAFWTYQAGHYDAARVLYEALLPALFEVLSPDHQQVLEVRLQCATCTALTGDAGKALRQFSAIVPDAERVLGAEHLCTFGARESAAALMDAAGDKAGARQEFADLLPMAKKLFGAQHPITHAIRWNVIRLDQEPEG
jgi:hypothetical protein